MSAERFFRGLLAALRLQHVFFIDTTDDRYHRWFGKVAEALDEARSNGRPGSEAMPRTLKPSPFTGRYAAFDEALILLQRARLLRGHNPFFRKVELIMSEERAEALLGSYTEEERAVFKDLAKVFADAGDQQQPARASAAR